ncbi:MAG: hypothetical protein P8N23_05540 [Methylophilaceae bacterium]|nr:hypothetical protein [Methylophilaceae bacterium]MDG1453215.1 hypothetical protein [Methylophilaceae bacterium]
MAAHYDIWLIIISIIATSGDIFIAFGFVDKITQSPKQLTQSTLITLALAAGTTLWASHLLTFFSCIRFSGHR